MRRLYRPERATRSTAKSNSVVYDVDDQPIGWVPIASSNPRLSPANGPVVAAAPASTTTVTVPPRPQPHSATSDAKRSARTRVSAGQRPGTGGLADEDHRIESLAELDRPCHRVL